MSNKEVIYNERATVPGSEELMHRDDHEDIPPNKHSVQFLGINLLENILRRHSSISCSVPAMAAAGIVQWGLMDACEAVCNLAVGT